MIVFLRRTPPDATLDEISEFLGPALKGGLFKPKGEVISARLLEIKDLRSNTVEYHVIAHIKPDAAALRVIKKLHRQVFRGKRIGLHEYVVRSWKNDRRDTPAKPGEVDVERRLTPTRRRELQIKIYEIADQ